MEVSKGRNYLREKPLKGETKPTEETKISQMTGNTNNFSIITLNVNGLNSSIKRHRMAEWT